MPFHCAPWEVSDGYKMTARERQAGEEWRNQEVEGQVYLEPLGKAPKLVKPTEHDGNARALP